LTLWDDAKVADQFVYQFEWDARKARTNLKQHGVTFERAATVFSDRRALSEYDSEHSEIEDRWITMGLDHSGILLVVCHTYRQEKKASARVRIISARKATRNESKQYKEK